MAFTNEICNLSLSISLSLQFFKILPPPQKYETKSLYLIGRHKLTVLLGVLRLWINGLILDFQYLFGKLTVTQQAWADRLVLDDILEAILTTT